MSEKSAKAEPVHHADGATVKFRTGRSATEFTATVTGREGQFLVTTDAAGKVRKVRHGAATAA